VKFAEGDFSDEWLEWIDDNLSRGVDASAIVRVLSSKGFHPHRNLPLMQRIIAWKCCDKFMIEMFPEFDISTSATLDVHFKNWAVATASK
jgi:hypothetical protein